MSTLPRLTLAFSAGLLAGLLTSAPVVAVVSLSAAIPFLLLLRSARPRTAALLLFALLGAARGAVDGWRARNDCRARIADGTRVVMSGVFDGHVAADTAAFLRVETLRVDGQRATCTGTIRARVSAAAASQVRAGRHVEVAGTWWAFPEAGRWPTPAERRGTLSVRSVRTIEGGDAGHALLHVRADVQRRMRALFGPHAGLAEALLLARREALDPHVRTRFAAAGMAHLLAISGMHVGILAAVLLLVGRLLRLAHTPAALFAVTGTLGYVLLLGAPWAATRAALQATLLFTARWTQRPADPLSVLAATALALMACDAFALLDVGFQLSFAGIWGILAFRGVLQSALPRAAPRPLRDAIATSLAAMLVTAPIAALHFGQASIIGLLANLAGTPVLGLAVPALAVTLLCDTVLSPVARFLAGGTRVLLGALDRVAITAAAVPGGHFTVSSAALFAALLGALAFLGAGAFERGSSTRRADGGPARRRTVLRLALAILVWYAWPLLGSRGSGRVEIHAIDVGQGDAFAIRSPAGRWILVDTGPRSETFDAGRARVLPFLLEHGVRRIEAVVLTHPHADHIGGVSALLESVRIGMVLDPAVSVAEPLYADVLASARARGVRWYAGRAGREIDMDGMTMRVLSPVDSLLDDRMDPNDYSVVFHLAYGRFGALFLGDAPRSVENRIVAGFGDAIASDVLKVGHHGSRTSTGDSLLAATRPRIALVSAGRRNRYGHPAAEVMARLAQNGVRVLRTDVNGSVVVYGDAEGVVEARAVRSGSIPALRVGR